MKKLMIVAIFGTAALFTACGDDSSSSSAGGAGGNSATQLDGKAVVSCDRLQTIAGIQKHYCHAIAAEDAGVEAFKAKCAPMSELDQIVYTIGTGCQGYLLACNAENQVEYFYDDAAAVVGCNMAGAHAF